MTDLHLLPYPQRLLSHGADCLFSDRVAIVVDAGATGEDRFAAENLALRLGAWGLVASVRKGKALVPGTSIVLTREAHDLPENFGDQGYTLVAAPDGVTVSASTATGLFYGTRTLLQLLQAVPEGVRVPGVEITDWPDIPYRAAHYDTKHHQDTADYVRQFIRDLADWKINVLVWEWEDKFAYPSHPEIGAPGAFTMDEMQAFTAYARQYHIQLVPLVQGLGHASFILKWPRHAHLREIPASNWEFCPYKEGTYDLLGDLWRDAIEATPGSEFIHIGTDETYELGLGEACGCRARVDEIGRRGLLMHFLQRSTDVLAGSGRRVMAWGGEYRPGDVRQPPAGLIVAEFTEDLEIAAAAAHAGYPAWIYDPNPGIEHLFLPYVHRLHREEEIAPCLRASQERLAPAARSGLFEGMINTSWDDSGLHNQVWMMSFANSAAWSWNGSAPSLEAFIDSYFALTYGAEARDLRELWDLLNRGAYFYMDSFERKVWHWGDVGKTHLPDLPRGDAVEVDPYWRREYAGMLTRAGAQLEAMARAVEICQANLRVGAKHAYDFEVFLSIANLISHTARTYLVLAEVEAAIIRAHKQHFVDHAETDRALGEAMALVAHHLDARALIFESLVMVWEKTRLPKGLSLPGKPYFHRQDRARHFANRRPDMTYLIYDEQLLDLEGYLARLRRYRQDYAEMHLTPDTGNL